MKLVLLATISFAVAVLGGQSVLSPVHDRFNELDDRLRAVDEDYEADGWFSSSSDSWLDNVDSTMFGDSFTCFDEESVFEMFEDKDEMDDVETAGNLQPDHTNHTASSSMTIYQLIKGSQFTTKMAAFIDADPDNELARTLDDPTMKHTIFVPTDSAFEKISKNHPQLSPGAVRKMLYYHISSGTTHLAAHSRDTTVPTLYKEPGLGGDRPQRLSIRPDYEGSKFVNSYARVVADDIAASNGLIQAVDYVLAPPPSTLSILSLLPGEFSTALLGLARTNLSSVLQAKVSASQGGTFFAPSNGAFRSLGPHITAFLFSAAGEKYLRALLEYHIVRNQTLYSDVLYTKNGEIKPLLVSPSASPVSRSFIRTLLTMGSDFRRESAHVELATMLGNRSITVDIEQLGPFFKRMINGKPAMATTYHARDGNIIVLDDVMLPSKGDGEGEGEDDDGERRRYVGIRRRIRFAGMCPTLEEFKARFAGLVIDDGDDVDFEFDLLSFLDIPDA